MLHSQKKILKSSQMWSRDLLWPCDQKRLCHSPWTELRTYLTKDNLWCQVLWGPAKRPGPALHPFRESKICYLGNGV